MNTALDIFKNKNFLYYWLAGWISSLGDAIFIIALTWLLIDLTNSSVVVGSYLFVVGITKLVFILAGGVIVDRIDNRKLLIFSDVARAMMMVGLFAAGIMSDVPLSLFYVLGVLFGAVDSIAEPAAISCRTRIVDKVHYTQSMSLLMIAGNASAVIGPMVGAGLVVWKGPLVAILVNGLSFVVSAVLLLIVRFKPIEGQEHGKNDKIVADFITGIKYFFNTPIILAMATFALFANAAVGTTSIVIPFLAKELELGVQGFGLMNTGMGIGSAAGAVIFSIFVIKNPKPYMTLLTCFLQGLMIFLVSLTHDLWVIVGLFALIGAHETAVNVIAPSVNHTIIPPKMFGRVISILILVMGGSVPFSQAITGVLLTDFSAQTIFAGAGLIEMLAAVITFALPVVRNHGRKVVEKR